MKYKHYLYIAIGLLVSACQIEDENAPSPDETYIKYFGDLTSHEASDIEIIYDVTGETPEGLVVFGTQVSDFGDSEYFILRTDLEGNLLDSVAFGLSDTLDIDEDGFADDWTGDGIPDRFKAEESAGQIHHVRDFGDGTSGFAFIGTSSITINALGVSDWKWLTVGFLDNDLNPITFDEAPLLSLFDASPDELLDFVGNDIIQINTGGFLLVGGREFDRGGGDSDFDNLFIRFNFQDGLVFEETQGIRGDDEDDILVRVFQKQNGNLVMIGNSNTPSFRRGKRGI